MGWSEIIGRKRAGAGRGRGGETSSKMSLGRTRWGREAVGDRERANRRMGVAGGKLGLQQRARSKEILQKIGFCYLLIQRSFCLPLLPPPPHRAPSQAVIVEHLISDKASYCWKLFFCSLAV